MKRLLLPLLAAIALPTAVNANWFSGDIVVKNNLGKKYIVKKSTVTLEPEKIRILKYVLSGEVYRRIISKLQNDNPNLSYFIDQAEELEAKYPVLKLEMNKYNEQEIASYIIKYQPIFQNLNNLKIGMEQMQVICINPKFRNENFLKAYHEEQNQSLKLNALDKKVCNKYAKF